MACSRCSRPVPCRSREEMRAAHGTPTEFQRACAKALGDISLDEYAAAVRTYERDYFDAPESAPPETGKRAGRG